MRLAPLIFLLFLCGAAFGQKTKDHTVVVSELAEKIHAASYPKTPVRLAVVTFVPVQGNAVPANSYGDYLTESIIGKLSAQSDKLKLFERKRIDAILKENEFMLSGMLKPSEALKIGELLPIDALFSGTYTKLKSYIDVTGRLIDVTSGEILMSYTGRIKLSRNLKTLFPESQPVAGNSTTRVLIVSGDKKDKAPAETKMDIEARCKLQTENFQQKLHDLSTTAKLDVLVQEAMATPFENTCGKLHYHFINALSRYNLYPVEYQRFLLSTLDTISYPSGDDRAYTILSYLTNDRQVSEDEWKTGLATLRKVGDYTLSSYLGFMFNRIEAGDSIVVQKRADQFFSLLANNEIGLPRPIGYDRGFYEMMECLAANHALRNYVYGKYGSKLATEPDNAVSLHLMFLKRMYNDETDLSKKTRIIEWIADYFNRHVNRKSAEQLYDLARDFVPYPDTERSQFKIDKNREATANFPTHDLRVLVGRCRSKFSAYATETAYSSQREERINFCVMNEIPIPGVIPTMQEAKLVLQTGSLEEQHRIMKLLVQMGNHVAPLEETLVALLNKKSLENKELLSDIQTMALQTLGTLRTKNRTAIANMIASLRNYDKASDISSESLVAIGKAAVNPLIEQLSATTIHDGGLQYKLVVILGMIGKDAKPAETSLRNLLAKTSNSEIRYAIEATLQKFNE